MKTTSWNQCRMSPSKIGALCNPNCCLRCYWMMLRMKFKKPFSFPMPNIMHSLDAQEKQVAQACLDRNDTLPAYFAAFRDAVEILPMESLSGFHEDTGLELYGKPDLVLCDAEGLVSVIDNKTAQMKPLEHALTAQYAAQLNFYCWLLENGNETTRIVSRAGILYYAITALTDDELMKRVGKDFMWALLRPTMVEVEYNPKKILFPLFQLVRDLIDADEAPAGREGCEDCAILDAFQDCMKVTDRSRVNYMDSRERQKHFYDEQVRATSELDPVRQFELDCLPAIARAERPDGVLASWD